MPSGDGHLDGPLHLVLALDLGEIDIEGVAQGEQFLPVSLLGDEFRLLGEKLIGLAEIPDSVDFDSTDDGGLADIRHGEDDRLLAPRTGFEGEG